MKLLKTALLAIISLLVAFLLLFFIPGRFSGKMKYQKEYLLEKPAQTAFRTIMNPLYFSAWIPYYKGIQPISGELITPGSMNHIILEPKDREVRVLQTIVSMENNRQINASYEWNRWMITNTITMEDSDAGTLMRIEAEVHASGPVYRSFLFWGKKRIREELDSMFDGLSVLINRAGTPNPFAQ